MIDPRLAIGPLPSSCFSKALSCASLYDPSTNHDFRRRRLLVLTVSFKSSFLSFPFRPPIYLHKLHKSSIVFLSPGLTTHHLRHFRLPFLGPFLRYVVKHYLDGFSHPCPEMDNWRVAVLGDGGVGKTALAVQVYVYLCILVHVF